MTTTQEDRRFRVLVTNKGRKVRADYWGGAYIELTFGSAAFRPTEVINVWDDETDTPRIQRTNLAVRAAVLAWIAEKDVEWPEWYESYLANR